MKLQTLVICLLALSLIATVDATSLRSDAVVGGILSPCPTGQVRCEDGTCQDVCPLDVVVLTPVPGALPELPGFCDEFTCDDGRCLEREEDCRCSEELPYMCDDGRCVGEREDCETDEEPVQDEVEEDDEVLPNNGGGAHPVFMDVEGDTQGDAEVRGWDPVKKEDIEEGPQEAKKPKEIVVVGTKTTADDKHKEWIEVLSVGSSAGNPDSPVITGRVYSVEDVQTLAEALIILDGNIKNINITENVTTVTYDLPAKLFGVFRYSYSMDVKMESGQVKVKFPWLLALSTDNADEILTDLEAKEDGMNSATQQLVTLNSVMAQYRETDVAFVGR